MATCLGYPHRKLLRLLRMCFSFFLVWFCWHFFRSFLFLRKLALSWGWGAFLFSFVGSFCFIFFSYFMLGLFCFFVSFVCCTSCRIASRGGYTTATRWGGTTAILLEARGIFLPPVGVSLSFLCSSFDFFFGSIYLLLCPCSVSLHISVSFVSLFLCSLL